MMRNHLPLPCQRVRQAAALTACAGALFLLVPMSSAGDDASSLSYIAYLERYATVVAAADGQRMEAQINLPVVPGDRIDTARRGRAEMVLADGSLLWLDEYSSLAVDAIANSADTDDRRTVLYLADGRAALELPDYHFADFPTRIDSAAGTIELEAEGLYFLAADENELSLTVVEGRAKVRTASGLETVRAGWSVEIEDSEIIDAEPVIADSQFFAWVQERLSLDGESLSSQYVDRRYARSARSLDLYGSWVFLPNQGFSAWVPNVGVDWRPYRHGRWIWTSIGWNWVAHAPWGWMTSHYGSWFFDTSYGWLWRYDPWFSTAWVSWYHWGGSMYWCPSGWYDSWYWAGYNDGYYQGHHDGYQEGLGDGYRDSGIARLDHSGRVSPTNLARDGFTGIPLENLARLGVDLEPIDLPRGDRGDLGTMLSGPLVTPRPGSDLGNALVKPFSGIDREVPTALLARDSNQLQGRELPSLEGPATRTPGQMTAIDSGLGATVERQRRVEPNRYRTPTISDTPNTLTGPSQDRSDAEPWLRNVPRSSDPATTSRELRSPQRQPLTPGTTRAQPAPSREQPAPSTGPSTLRMRRLVSPRSRGVSTPRSSPGSATSRSKPSTSSSRSRPSASSRGTSSRPSRSTPSAKPSRSSPPKPSVRPSPSKPKKKD